MDNQLQKELIKQLNKTLEQARDAYYKKATPIMSDADYDAGEKLLRQYVTEAPHLAEYAPVLKTVGSDLTTGGRIKHASPMLSIENQYTFDDVLAWCKKLPPNTKIILEPKFDGISVSLIYEHGKLVRALTRGTGSEGEEITAQVGAVKSIPKTITGDCPCPCHTGGAKHMLPCNCDTLSVLDLNIEVRGELVMKNSTLAEINTAGGKQYSSTRNLTAGTMKQRDLSIVASRDIMLMPWQVIQNNVGGPDSNLERLRFIGNFGFLPPFGNGVSSDDEDSIINLLNQRLAERESLMRKSLSLETDGVVIKVDSQKLRDKLGVASKYTNWQVCYKPQSASGTTYLREIQWQVGRTGKITPVAKCDVVVLAGANVTSASLNNITYINNMGLKLGAKVEMLRSGDVIPQIVRVIDEGDEVIEEPSLCPECNADTVSRDEGGAGIMQLFCTNLECPAVQIGYLAFVGSRDVLEIDHLGPEMAKRLVDGNYARNLAELYEFHGEMSKALEIFGEEKFIKTVRAQGFDANLPKMLRSLEEAKTRSWERWIKALAIPMIGETLGKVIAEKLDLKSDDFGLLVSTGLIPFTQQEVDGFGEAKMKAIADWCTAENNALCGKLHQLGIRPTPVEKPKVVAGAPLAGISFVITGEFSEERDKLTKKLVSLGAVAKSGVSKNVNLLIVGDAAGKTKLTKAASLGIKQVGKDWLEKTLADNGLSLKADTFAAENA